MKQKKTNGGWILKPGERYNLNELMEKVINTYLGAHSRERIIVLNETDEMIYFVHMSDTNKIVKSSVAMSYRDNYIFLPEEMAMDLARSYMLQIELTAEAYEYLEATHGE